MKEKNNQFDSVMELKRRLVGEPNADFTGVFEPDPAEVEKWGRADQSYEGQWRYVNKSPMELRRMLETEEDADEIEAIQAALEYWAHVSRGKKVSGGAGCDIGEPYRGEAIEVAMPTSMSAIERREGAMERVSGSFRDVAKQVRSGNMGNDLGMGNQVGMNWEEP